MIQTVEAIEYEIVLNRGERVIPTLGKPRAEIVIQRAQRGERGLPGIPGQPGASTLDDPGDLVLLFENKLI